MSVACVDLTWATMGKIQEERSSIPPHAFHFLTQKANCKKNVVVTFWTQCFKCLLMHIYFCWKDCQILYMWKHQITNLPHLKRIVTTICYLEILFGCRITSYICCTLPPILSKNGVVANQYTCIVNKETSGTLHQRAEPINKINLATKPKEFTRLSYLVLNCQLGEVIPLFTLRFLGSTAHNYLLFSGVVKFQWPITPNKP